MIKLTGRFRSLRTKLVLPILFLGLVISAIVLRLIYRESELYLLERLQARGERAAHAIYLAAESMSHPEDLRRFVHAMGAEEDFKLIILAAGSPFRIIASTKTRWIGENVSNVRYQDLTEDLINTYKLRKESSEYHKDNHELHYSLPIVLHHDNEGGADAVLSIHLNTSKLEATVKSIVVKTSWIFAVALSILIVMCHLLIHYYTVQPLSAAHHALRGNIDIEVDDLGVISHNFANDEIGSLVQRLYEERVKADKATHELSHVSYSLNQAAIVAITDTKGTIKFVNDRFQEISGYSLEELIGANHRILNSGLHSKEFFQEMYRTIGNGGVWRGEIRNRSKSGKYYWVDTSIIPEVNINGKVQGYTAIRFDITARKEAEERINKAREAAEDLARAKSDFLAVMSHEIRTPMNGIIGMTSLALETKLTDEQREYLETVKGSADSLLTIINDILDFSKVEAGRVVLSPIKFQLKDKVIKTTNILKSRIEERRVQFFLEFGDDLPEYVIGDDVRLGQVITNILGNAVKFTTEQGMVFLRITLDSIEANKAKIKFSVSDTGIGIPEDKLQVIFEPFSQADGSTTRRFGGTGLGLSISKNLVELMGGEIWVESKVGLGTTFHFTTVLEVIEQDSNLTVEMDKIKSQSIKAPRRSTRVLLVEDNKVNQKLAKVMLEKEGCIVTVVEDGQEAVAMIFNKQDIFDLVFMDCQMPILDGFKATNAIRSMEQGTEDHIPIVAMTANAMEGDRERCIKAGMDDYLSKPIDKERVKDILDKYSS